MSPEESLFEEYAHLAEVTVHKLFFRPQLVAQSKHLELDDLYQYARLGLYDACKNYHKNPIGTFKNFAIRNMRWSIMKYLDREQMTKTLYKATYYKSKNENQSVTVVSMSRQPDPDIDVTYYDMVSVDNINKFNDESIESKVICDLETNEIFNILKEHEKELLRMKLNDMNNKEIADVYGISRQAISFKFKQIQAKVNRHIGVVTA